MKLVLSLILLIVLVPSLASVAVADEQPDAAQTVDNLRFKLLDIQGHEAELQNRVRQLEEDIKPENIERSLAGVGSTKPEELREFRRRQISIELEGVRNQQKILAANRERLEAAIRTAEAEAYHQSAQGANLPAAQVLRARAANPPSLMLVAGAIGLLALVFAVTVRRRTSINK